MPTLPPHVLSEPATIPPVLSMVIRCPHLPWKITILPTNTKYVTVRDVTYKSRGLGQAKPGPSRGWRLWPGLCIQEAKAASSQAKAAAFRPSRAGTALKAEQGEGNSEMI